MGVRTRSCALFTAIIVLLTPAMSFAMGAAPQRMAVVRGAVTNQDGTPLEGVRIVIEQWYNGPRLVIGATGAGDRESINEVGRRSGGNSRSSRDDGTFSYPDLDVDVEYRVRFEKDGYIPREEKLVFRVGGNDIGTFVMISGNVEVARRGYEDGYEAFEKGDCPAAIAGMEEVVGVYGESDSSDQMLTVALGVLGQCYLQHGRADDAYAALSRLIEIRLDNAIAHRGLGQVAAMRGQMPKALEHFDIAVQLEPDSAVGRYLFGYALQLNGRNDEAIVQLEACIDAESGFVQAYKSLGMAWAAKGDNGKAIENLEEYLDKVPGAPDRAEVEAKLAELRKQSGIAL